MAGHCPTSSWIHEEGRKLNHCIGSTLIVQRIDTIWIPFLCQEAYVSMTHPRKNVVQGNSQRSLFIWSAGRASVLIIRMVGEELWCILNLKSFINKWLNAADKDRELRITKRWRRGVETWNGREGSMEQGGEGSVLTGIYKEGCWDLDQRDKSATLQGGG